MTDRILALKPFGSAANLMATCLCHEGLFDFEDLCVFKGGHFDRSVIVLCVRWYLAYNLSLRDLEEMMAE